MCLFKIHVRVDNVLLWKQESRSSSKSDGGSPARVKSESRSGSPSPSRASKCSKSRSRSHSKSRYVLVWSKAFNLHISSYAQVHANSGLKYLASCLHTAGKSGSIKVLWQNAASYGDMHAPITFRSNLKVNVCHPLYSGLAPGAAQTTATVALALAPAPAPAAGSPAPAPTAQSTTAGGAAARRLCPAGAAMQAAGWVQWHQRVESQGGMLCPVLEFGVMWQTNSNFK